MSTWNRNRFSVFTSDEKDALGLIEELGKQTNDNSDALASKTDLTGDHKGSWQGLSKPTLSEEGMRATVEKHIIDIANLKNTDSSIYDYVDGINTHVDKTYNNSTFETIISNLQNSSNNMCYNYYVGDSIFASNGTYILDNVIKAMDNTGIHRHTRQCQSGLRLDHWVKHANQGEGYFTIDNLLSAIPTNSNYPQHVFFELGINRHGNYTKEEYLALYKKGFDMLIAQRPDVKICLISPMRWGDTGGVDKVSWCYKELTKYYDIAYINLIDNIFKEFNDRVQGQYFVDPTHPNEKGQRKMADYIIEKLGIINYPIMSKSVKFGRFLLGRVAFSSKYYKWGKNSGLRIEIVQTGGSAKIVEPILKKTNGKFYIHFDKNTPSSLSTEIKPQNAIQTLTKASWSTVDCIFTARIEFTNYDIFNEIVDNEIIELSNSTVVSSPSGTSTLENILYEILDRI
ncbi:MAG: SGNH/GDSL hydrolase family protein [Paraclostridium sp.]